MHFTIANPNQLLLQTSTVIHLDDNTHVAYKRTIFYNRKLSTAKLMRGGNYATIQYKNGVYKTLQSIEGSESTAQDTVVYRENNKNTQQNIQ